MSDENELHLVSILADVLRSENRSVDAPRAAKLLGADNMILFSEDPVLHIALPAAGFPQTLPVGRRWREFLKGRADRGIRRSVLSCPYTDREMPVVAVHDGDGTVLVLLGGSPSPETLERLSGLLPLVGQSLQRELQVRHDRAAVHSMRGEIANARQLTGALDTLRRELEVALEKASSEATVAEQATRELLRANEQLASARDQALSASQAKSAFLANMSHELRTPLTAVIGYAEMLQDELIKPEAKADLLRIQGAGQHLLLLVNDILDMAKIEAGKAVATPEKFALVDMLEEAADVVRPQAMVHGNAVVVCPLGPLPNMHTDRGKLRQVLLNLLGNAVKFTHDGTVTLSATFVPAEAMVHIRVADTGIGISAGELPDIFTEFTQVANTSGPKAAGTGLGLSISRRLCQLLGGQIVVKSRLGEGSVFTVKIPQNLPAEIRREEGEGC